MKKLKKLIPALCMLLVSAVLLGTTTYAWFSMNTSVAANNLGVTARSNASYLLIDKKDNAETKTDSKTEVTESDSTAKVYPVAYYATTTADTTIGSVKLSAFNGYDESTWVGSNKWFTANNGNSNASKDDVKNAKLVTEADENYMVKYEYYITLTADSEAFQGNLNVAMTSRAAISGANNSDAVNAVVLIEAPVSKETANTKVVKYVNLTTVTTAGKGINVPVYLTGATSIKVTVYVYVNGESELVTSANANALSGKLNLAFDLGTNELLNK